MELDANGWALGAVEPLPADRAWSLVSPEPSSRIDAGRWAHQARTFFGALVELATPKRYPSATLPLSDAGLVEVRRLLALETERASRLRFLTVPLDRAPAIRAAAVRGAAAIGGAGFDVLVNRGQRLWQVEDAVDAGGDPRAPLVVAALLASVFLAPIVPPEGGTIFGVKGARERLERLGWR